MKPKNITLRRRLADVESQLEAESLSSRHSRRLKEERQRRLTEEKITIQRSLDSIVYPILTLPVETTSEIFLHCLPDYAIYPSGAVAPMLLGRICRQWRNIACGIPRLWATLMIHHQFGARKKNQLLLREWLRRARTAPLSLHLWLPYWEHSSSILATLTLPFTDHWAYLTSFHGSCFTPADCVDLLARAPRLTHCEFTQIASALLTLSPSDSRLLLARLQYLKLSSSLLLVLDSLTAPALHSLKIMGQFPNLPVLHSFLDRAPKLRTFEASYYGHPPVAAGEIVPTLLRAMPLLTSLRLSSTLSAILQVLHLLNKSPTFLPRIQHIAFSASVDVHWTDSNIKTFVDAVTSRWEVESTAAQLLDFELLLHPSRNYQPIFDEKVSACVSRLEEQGMDIYVGPAY